MKHQTKLTLTSTTPEHIGLKNRPREIVKESDEWMKLTRYASLAIE